MTKIRVLIADDHAVLRQGIAALLDAAADIEVVGEAADGLEAVQHAERLAPDIVLMDVAMPGLGGLEATLEILRRRPETRVLVLTQHEDAEYIRRFIQAGASGYLLKRAVGVDLAASIRAARTGGLVLDPDVARQALQAGVGEPAASATSDPYESLTTREKQVLKLVAEGLSNKEVAELLDISVKTAMSHREHLMEKLGLHSRTELVKFAIRHGVTRA